MLDLKDSFNKVIKTIVVYDSSCVITFEDDKKIEFFDNNQSCCEHRYMNTDDCTSLHKGARLISASVSDGPSTDNGNVLDCQFLIITTNKGFLTIANYNEHNGYYGGFDIIIK